MAKVAKIGAGGYCLNRKGSTMKAASKLWEAMLENNTDVV